MVLKEDQIKVKALLAEAITVLCKNGLQYRNEFSVEGLLGITLDNEEVFLININESVYNRSEPPAPVQTSPSVPTRTPARPPMLTRRPATVPSRGSKARTFGNRAPKRSFHSMNRPQVPGPSGQMEEPPRKKSIVSTDVVEIASDDEETNVKAGLNTSLHSEKRTIKSELNISGLDRSEIAGTQSHNQSALAPEMNNVPSLGDELNINVENSNMAVKLESEASDQNLPEYSQASTSGMEVVSFMEPNHVVDKKLKIVSMPFAIKVEKRIPCEYCDKVFRSEVGLYYHKPIHTGQWKYKCVTCDRGFMQLEKYNRHTKAHNKQHELNKGNRVLTHQPRFIFVRIKNDSKPNKIT